MDHAAKLAVALDWLAQPCSGDKLAGVLLISEHLAPPLDDMGIAALAARSVAVRSVAKG